MKKNRENKFVTVSIIRYSFMRICSVSMFCEDSNICKRIANEVISTLISISSTQSSVEIKYVLFIELRSRTLIRHGIFFFVVRNNELNVQKSEKLL